MEQVRQRQALEDTCKTIRIASNTRTNFFSSMSRNARVPMNATISMSVIAQSNLNSLDEIQNCLTEINTSSRHLLNLIDEVLDMSKVESGRIDLMYEGVPLPKLIKDVVDVFRPLVTGKYQAL